MKNNCRIKLIKNVTIEVIETKLNSYMVKFSSPYNKSFIKEISDNEMSHCYREVKPYTGWNIFNKFKRLIK